MKLRYFLTSIIACLALAIGCTQEELPALSEIQVTPSYFTFGVDGGSKTVTVTAMDAWEVTDVPAWLNVSPAKGEATGAEGVKVTITAGPTTAKEIQTASLKFNCAGKAQLVTVGQEAFVPEFPAFTAGEYWIMTRDKASVVFPIDDGGQGYGYMNVVKAVDGKSTADNIYTFAAVEGEDAGFTIVDTKGQYHIGSTYNSFTVSTTNPKDGSEVWYVKQISADEYEITNKVNNMIVFMSTYGNFCPYPKGHAKVVTENPYPCLVSASGDDVVEVMFAVEPTEVELEKEAGDFNINMTCKNEGFEIKPSASWIVLKGMTSTEGEYVVTFSYEANEGGARSATIDFISGEETITVEVVQLGGIADATVAEFLAAEVGEAQYRVSGILTSVAKAEYGNVYIKDATGELYVYGIGAKGDFEKLGLKVGDIVTVIGKRAEYKGSPQMSGGQYESHKAVTTMKAADVAALADDDKENPANYIMLTGKVSQPASGKFDLETYGNFDLVDESGSIYVYGVSTGWNGETKKFASLGVKENDIITIVAYKTSYKESPQVVGMYVSHEAGSTEGGEEGGNDDPAVPASGKYVKVTAEQSDWSGKYLIVWDGNAHASLLSGKKDLNSTAAVTVVDGAIEASADLAAATMTVVKNGDKYSMAFADGKYFGMQHNGCLLCDEAFDLTFEYTADGVKVGGVPSGKDATYYLYANTNNGAYYRCYVDKNGQAGYALPELYKLAE